MSKTILEQLSNMISAIQPENKEAIELIESLATRERRQIEAAYNAGQKDHINVSKGFESCTADKYYFMTYIDND